MTFDEYQEAANKTAVYPKITHGVIYPTLGLTNEAGEVAGKVKKVMRDEDGIFSEERLDDIKKELGDVLWYIAQTARELDISLEEVAMSNVNKLASRGERGKLKGSGDNR